MLLLHFNNEIFLTLPAISFLEPIVANGGFGVDLFFLLSGFILSHQYLDRLGEKFEVRAFLTFIRLRIARVYPVHFVMLNVSLLLLIAAGALGVSINADSATRNPASYVQNLFLVQAWAGQPYSWNGVAWSVSAEWFAYLLFPLFALVVFRARSTWHLAVALAAVVCVAVVFGATPREGSESAGPDFALARISLAFAIGCISQRLLPAVREKWAIGLWSPFAGITIVLVSCYLPVSNSGILLVGFSLLVTGLAIGVDPVSKVLAIRPFVYGGEISYSLYMVHAIVFAICRKFFPLSNESTGLIEGSGYLALSFLSAFLAAAVTYHFIEKPGRRLIRGTPASGQSVVPVDRPLPAV